MLPRYHDVVDALRAAEQQNGWLLECEARRTYLSVNRELIRSLARLLRRIAGGGRILEVCAGNGELAIALHSQGLSILATDSHPPEDACVARISAQEALRRHTPGVVLGSFVPFDVHVDEAILATASVKYYVVLNARLNGEFGSSGLWRSHGWAGRPVPEIARWMICRHDTCLFTKDAVIRHGEAWCFHRTG